MRRKFKFPPGKTLTREHERDLIVRAQRGDKEAMHELVIAHRPWVVAQLHKWVFPAGISFEDVEAEGIEGLIVGIHKFNLSHDVRLFTYARHWIRIHATRFLERNASVVAQSATRDVRVNRWKLKDAIRRTIQKNRGSATPHEVAVELNVPLEVVTELMRGGDASTEAEAFVVTHSDMSAPTPENLVEYKERVELCCAVTMGVLRRRTRRDAGMFEFWLQTQNFRAVGDRFKLSRERVRQIIEEILVEIRSKLDGMGVAA